MGGRWARALAIAAGGLIAAAAYFSPALIHLDETGFGDWQQFQHQWEAAWVTVARWGEMPLWNPFHCAGVTLYGDPQAQAYGPLFWLLYPLGTTLGLKVFLILHAAAGLVGMVLYAQRALGLGRAPALLAAVVWACSGFFAWHGSGGHSAFLPFYFAPWLLLAWRKAADDPRWAAAVAAIMALCLFEGGVYPFPYFSLLLAFDGLVRLGVPEERRGVMRAGLLVIPLMLLLGSFRLLPTLETLELYPRPTAGNDVVSLTEALDMLTARDHDYDFGHEYVWAEYGSYVGWGALVLGALGVPIAWLRRRRRLVVGALLFGGLMLGYGSAFHPWALLHALPPFDSLRVPSRFAVLFTFFLALLAASALEALIRALARGRLPRGLDWARRGLPWLILLAVAVDVTASNMPTIDRWRGDPLPDDIVRAGRVHLISPVQYGRYASFPALGVSNRGCYTGMEYRAASGLWEGDRPQVRVEATRGDVHDEGRTANTMWAEVTLAGEGRVVFNQTWAPGWETGDGIVEPDGRRRVSVLLPAGHHRVALRYVPRRFRVGAAGTLFGLLGALVLLFAGRPGMLRSIARDRRRLSNPGAQRRSRRRVDDDQPS